MVVMEEASVPVRQLNKLNRPSPRHGRRCMVLSGSVMLNVLLGAKGSRASTSEAVGQKACEKRQTESIAKVIFPCAPGPCVSTASFNKPSQYSSPWIIPEGTSLAQARNQLEQALEDLGATIVSCVILEKRGGNNEEEVGGEINHDQFVLVAKAEGWGEEMKFLLKKDRGLGNVGLVTFTISAQASSGSGRQGTGLLTGKLSIPDPPGCLEEGCISGPPQRRYVEALRNSLQWSPLETDEDKKWVQIMGK